MGNWCGKQNGFEHWLPCDFCCKHKDFGSLNKGLPTDFFVIYIVSQGSGIDCSEDLV